jgi:hypothetical protein
MESSFNFPKYYLYYEGLQQGPISLNEINAKGIEIHSNTLVWTKGMKEWEKAESVNDFKYLIQSNLPPDLPKGLISANESPSKVEIPPNIPEAPEDKSESTSNKQLNEAIVSVTSDSDKQDQKENLAENTWNAESKSHFNNRANTSAILNKKSGKQKFGFIVVGIIFIFIIIWLWNQYQENSRHQLLVERRQDIHSKQLQKQQEIIDEHKREIEAQKLAERMGKIEQLKEAKMTLQSELESAQVYLDAAVIKLEDLKQWQFLRSASEKDEQIKNQLSIIQGWEEEKKRLKNEIIWVQREINDLKQQVY